MSGQSDLLTLSEVSKRTKISMPTLQRYKKEYQRRIPSVGKGRKQRYPVEALAVVQAIKQENLAQRGRRKGAPKPTRRRRKPPAQKPTRGRRTAGRRRTVAGADGSLARRMRALEKAQAGLERQIKALLKQLRKPVTVTIGSGR